MTTDDQTTGSEQPGDGNRPWLWVAIAAGVVALIALGIVLFGGDDDDVGTTTTTTEGTSTTTVGSTTTTIEATTTTTSAQTTTTQAVTTTTLSAFAVPTTPVIAALAPYPPEEEGAALTPTPVEAHWYQYEGLYVVLYRGLNASSETPLCPGNSIQDEGGSFSFVSSSPFLGTAEEVCNQAPRIAEPPSGAYACGSLLYYLTEIPTDNEGTLFGTLEVSTDAGFIGQTGQVAADLAVTPEFTPEQTAYELPATEVDPGGLVTCPETP